MKMYRHRHTNTIMYISVSYSNSIELVENINDILQFMNLVPIVHVNGGGKQVDIAFLRKYNMKIMMQQNC